MSKRQLLVLGLAWLGIMACGLRGPAHTDPADETFYATCRFIMSAEEEKIYLHLPDEKAKEDFADEFWRKRDPTPATPENENKQEYELRIAFANNWFREKQAGGGGWNSDRGRTLLQLGFPDQRDLRTTTSRGTTWQVSYEIWYYERYHLRLQFLDREGFGQFRLTYFPPEMLSAIDDAQREFGYWGKDKAHQGPRFSLSHQGENLVLHIPLRGVQFSDNGQEASASFSADISVYRQYAKVDQFTKQWQNSLRKEAVAQLKELTWQIPYVPSASGKYYVEVVLRDLNGNTAYRNFCKFTY